MIQRIHRKIPLGEDPGIFRVNFRIVHIMDAKRYRSTPLISIALVISVFFDEDYLEKTKIGKQDAI